MSNLHTHMQYNDPLTIIARKGDAVDPFVDRTDSLPVINSMITLLEIPSSTDKVVISGFVEIDQHVYEKKQKLAENEFLVHYGMGTIQFHPSQEGRVHLCRYKGRGLIMYPASRIYAMITRNPDVIKTLQDFIEESQRKLDETQLAMERVEEVIQQSIDQTGQARHATDHANQAADEALEAANRAKDAYKTTRLVYKGPVSDLRELRDTYPFPETGWTVQTYKDGKRYRYDGNNWIEIDIFGQNLQVVNPYRDGLMSVAEHLKLNEIPLEVQDRVIVFCKESYVFQEVIGVVAPFPFHGEILDVKGFCGVYGETETEIRIEKSRDLIHWVDIMESPLEFNALAHVDNKKAKFSNKQVSAGDLFRIQIIKAGLDIQHLTIQLTIRT